MIKHFVKEEINEIKNRLERVNEFRKLYEKTNNLDDFFLYKLDWDKVKEVYGYNEYVSVLVNEDIDKVTCEYFKKLDVIQREVSKNKSIISNLFDMYVNTFNMNNGYIRTEIMEYLFDYIITENIIDNELYQGIKEESINPYTCTEEERDEFIERCYGIESNLISNIVKYLLDKGNYDYSNGSLGDFIMEEIPECFKELAENIKSYFYGYLDDEEDEWNDDIYSVFEDDMMWICIKDFIAKTKYINHFQEHLSYSPNGGLVNELYTQNGNTYIGITESTFLNGLELDMVFLIVCMILDR